ncbi:MAG TPA: hypothetical protein VF228_08960 [Iamia sp.]
MTTGPEGLPWPDGNPGAIEGAAGRLRSMAGQVGRIAGRTTELADVGGWTGPASTVYSAAMTAHAVTLARGAGPLGTAAARLRALGDELGDAQREIRRLATEVRQAEDAAERACTAAATARADWQAGEQPDPFVPVPASLGGLPPASVVQADGAATRATDHAAEVRRRATARARALCDQVEAADRTAAAALDAAAGAAPGGAGAPGVPGGPGPSDGVPGVVARYAPVFLFHPEEKYLPADATEDWLRYLSRGEPLPVWDPEWAAGQGQGAPIYFHYDRETGRIDYWFWRRFNDFRNQGIQTHPGDWEGVSVRIGPDGRPTHVGYRQHGPISAQPYDDARTTADGRPLAWPALGSAASYHEPGSYDEAAGPLNDLAGGKPGERPKVVDGGMDLQEIERQPWAGEDDRFGDTPGWWPLGGSPTNPLSQEPGDRWWETPVHEPDDTVH